jgi:hypothetical protein
MLLLGSFIHKHWRCVGLNYLALALAYAIAPAISFPVVDLGSPPAGSATCGSNSSSTPGLYLLGAVFGFPDIDHLVVAALGLDDFARMRIRIYLAAAKTECNT